VKTRHGVTLYQLSDLSYYDTIRYDTVF